MSALLKYVTFLALALAIGFFVYGALSLEDIAPVPAKQEAVAAPVDPGASASIYEELDYRVAQRLGSLEGWRAFLAANRSGVYAQSARAEVEKLLPAEKAHAPPAAESSNGQSPDATAAIEVDPDPSAVATEVAPPTSDEVCKRDGERFAQLRSNPSSDEARRFAKELGCEKLRPQVLGLIESSDPPVPAPAAPEVSPGASPQAKAANEAAHRAPRHAGMDDEPLAPDEICKRDGYLLARLRSSLSAEETQRFTSELSCEKLRPQLLRLMESLGLPAPANSSPSDSSPTGATGAGICASERAVLKRLREESTAEAARLFWRSLQCERLRPQVRLLMESLNLEPESQGLAVGSGEAEGSEGADARTVNGTDQDVCRRETAELNRIRATRDLGDAKRFASAVTCDALKPQAARLLKRLTE